MQTGDLTAVVERYLGRLAGETLPPEATPESVSFLARGEYSLNYLVRGAATDLVVRLVTGSQMGLAPGEQALYEHAALGLVAPSGVTPEPRLVDPDPEDLPYPLILEEFLPGRPLDYATDLVQAGRCIAKVHNLSIPSEHALQVHPDPAPAILEESRGLAAPYLEWDGADGASKAGLERGFRKIEGFLERKGLFTEDDLAIVNYDLNTHNFVVSDEGSAKLLDWEKARISPRAQDLAHFLLPTTTLWRDDTAALLSEEGERAFLGAYMEHGSVEDEGRFLEGLEAMKTIVSLRAVSWCAWALQETARGTRPITNEETLRKSRAYLEPKFLEGLFGP